MRIAFVTQPLDSVMPLRQNSIGVVVHNTARCLAAAHDVTIIAGSRYNPPSVAPDDSITYHFVGDEPDTPILGFLEHFPNWIPQERVLESRFFYRIYAERVARLLAKGNYDWVHVVNYSQFLPVLHRAAPRSHFNLEMHSYWLSQFPAREIRRRLAAADLVTCVSDDVAEQALALTRVVFRADRFHERVGAVALAHVAQVFLYKIMQLCDLTLGVLALNETVDLVDGGEPEGGALTAFGAVHGGLRGVLQEAHEGLGITGKHLRTL